MDKELLKQLAQRIRYNILVSTSKAGSGHPTTSLSAVELMVGLFFSDVFRFDVKNPDNPNNDRLIFSKGHASPLLYALWVAARAITEAKLMTLREFHSPLEGHPTPAFPYTEAATGSLGQGLSVGVGMALNAKLDQLSYRTYVLLGDSEMSEGSIWEAVELAAHYQLDNLVAVIDVNRLGQRGETMYGHDLEAYRKRLAAFDWHVVTLDGHAFPEIIKAYQNAQNNKGAPTALVAKTIKGKGVSFLEDQDGWHGKALKKEQLTKALEELGKTSKVTGTVRLPEKIVPKVKKPSPKETSRYDEPVATRKAYGLSLVKIYPHYPNIVVLDAEVSNSTFAEIFKNVYPEAFFEMYIAEQNMVGTALGFSRRGKIPFVSTFAAFLTRAFDQVRMSQYSDANIKFVGSHAGVSIGQDGPSQMGLEDLAIFRALLGSIVFYPADAFATEKLVEEAAKYKGIVYIRTTRPATPIIYQPEDQFTIGGSAILRESAEDMITVIGAGVTLFEALKAYEELEKDNIHLRVIDLYSIKPVDQETLLQCARETKALITVEDHFAEGGLGEAVMSALANQSTPIYSLAVRKIPKSGKPEELLNYEEISSRAIIQQIKKII
jgi:transketolase